MWRARFGRGFGPVVRQTTKWMNEWNLIVEVPRSHCHTTFGRTSQDRWSARRRDLYLTSRNTPKRQSCPQRVSNLQS
jgi:hypothetical protein